MIAFCRFVKAEKTSRDGKTSVELPEVPLGDAPDFWQTFQLRQQLKASVLITAFCGFLIT